MDILTLLMLMMLVCLVVIVIQLRRANGGGKCSCPVDQKWLDDFDRWSTAEDKWAGQVQVWIDAYNSCLEEKCMMAAGNVEPPNPPPCKFGSC